MPGGELVAHYFISDLHLDAKSQKMALGFLHFMANLEDAESLYILGDFFEAWIGDDYDDAFIRQLKQSFCALANKDTRIYIMHGNRDFLLGEQFAKDCQAELIDVDSRMIQIGEQQALLMHGDTLCTDDVDYLAFRAMVRNPEWKAGFLSQSIPERIAFAQKARSESQSEQKMKSNDIMDVTQNEVDKVMTEAGISLLIHGHTHRPNTHVWQHQGQERTRIVLGDWSDTQGWMIRWEEKDSPELSSFPLSEMI